MIKSYSKKYGTRTYQPGEQVLVDAGPRSKVKNSREALEAQIVAPIEGGEYRVQFNESPAIWLVASSMLTWSGSNHWNYQNLQMSLDRQNVP
jgi:hypothetical protein